MSSDFKTTKTVFTRGLQVIVSSMVLGVSIAAAVSIKDATKASSKSTALTISTNVVAVVHAGSSLIPAVAKAEAPPFILAADIITLALWISSAALSDEIFGATNCSAVKIFSGVSIDAYAATNLCNVTTSLLGAGATSIVLFIISLAWHIGDSLWPAISDVFFPEPVVVENEEEPISRPLRDLDKLGVARFNTSKTPIESNKAVLLRYRCIAHPILAQRATLLSVQSSASAVQLQDKRFFWEDDTEKYSNETSLDEFFRLEFNKGVSHPGMLIQAIDKVKGNGTLPDSLLRGQTFFNKLRQVYYIYSKNDLHAGGIFGDLPIHKHIQLGYYADEFPKIHQDDGSD